MKCFLLSFAKKSQLIELTIRTDDAIISYINKAIYHHCIPFRFHMDRRQPWGLTIYKRNSRTIWPSPYSHQLDEWKVSATIWISMWWYNFCLRTIRPRALTDDKNRRSTFLYVGTPSWIIFVTLLRNPADIIIKGWHNQTGTIYSIPNPNRYVEVFTAQFSPDALSTTPATALYSPNRNLELCSASRFISWQIDPLYHDKSILIDWLQALVMLLCELGDWSLLWCTFWMQTAVKLRPDSLRLPGFGKENRRRLIEFFNSYDYREAYYEKKMYLLAGVFFVLSLCSCSMQIATNGNHQESSSSFLMIGDSALTLTVQPKTAVAAIRTKIVRLPKSVSHYFLLLHWIFSLHLVRCFCERSLSKEITSPIL